jgi:hypothetical protein
MTTIRKIVTSKIDGNGADSSDTNEIRPFGETSFYIDGNNKLTLLMFDGVRTHRRSKVLSPGVLYGSNGDSGDGAGLDTIKLIPDAELYNNGSNQYLVVDPTTPNHIHIRAGGNIDNSTAELYLGGETNHFRVNDNGYAAIRAANSLELNIGNATYTLSYDQMVGSSFQIAGGIQGPVQTSFLSTNGLGITIDGFNTPNTVDIGNIPSSTVLRLKDGDGAGNIIVQSLGTSLKLQTNNNSTWEFNDNGSLTIPGTVEQGNAKLDLNWSDAGYVMLTSKTDYTTSVFLGEGQASLTGRIGAAIVVGEAGQNAQTTYEQKVIELDAAFAVESYTGAGYPAGPTSSQALNLAKALNPLIPDAWITIANELKTAWDTWQEVLTYSDVLIAVGGSDNVWKFDPTGNLTLPNNAVIRTDGSNVEVGGVTNFNVEAAGVVNIYTDTNGVAPHQWQFGDDGSLTFPDTTVQTTAYTGTGAITFTANEIEGNTFGGAGTTFSKSADFNGSDYSTGGGTLPFINMGADSDVDNIQVGWIVTFASGETRTVASEPYKPLGTYWFIGFNSSYSWSAGDVMPITFSSPDYVAGTDPEVTLTAGTQSWTFDDAGSITFPDASVQTTAYVPEENLVKSQVNGPLPLVLTPTALQSRQTELI